VTQDGVSIVEHLFDVHGPVGTSPHIITYVEKNRDTQLLVEGCVERVIQEPLYKAC